MSQTSVLKPYDDVKHTLESPVVKKMPSQHPDRPSVFTRPSNDDITNLTRVGPSHRPSTNFSEELPEQQAEIKNHLLTLNNPPKNKWRFISSCILVFVIGFADAAPGALLPKMEAYYHISYSVVSLIWICAAAGFIFVACISHLILKYIDRSRCSPIACFFLMVAYVISLSGGPFPLILVGFFSGGVGVAIVIAFINVFLSKFDKQSKYLAMFHGSYGVGATVSPLFATFMVNRGIKWHYVYIILVVLMFLTGIGNFLAFRGAQQDLHYWYEGGAPEITSGPADRNDDDLRTGQREVADTSSDEEAIDMQNLGPARAQMLVLGRAPAANDTTARQDMKEALKLPITWLLSMWVFFYQGGEVAIGGWIVTYLLDYRGADNTYGYVASGFWGGLALGRLFLTRPLHKYLGGRRGLMVISATTILLVVLTWVVPNNHVASVCVSLAGALIGPNYPLMITVVTQGMIPRRIQLVVLTIVSSFGLSGGALVPFIVGLLLQRFQSYVILPVFITVYSLMLIIWICLPNLERRRAMGTNHLTLWQKFW